MVARKPRNYKAEEERRNERAKGAGFSSRAQERGIRAKSATWSRKHAEKSVAFYHPKWAAAKVRAYYDAFVAPASEGTGFKSLTKTRRRTDAGKHWLVTVSGYMTSAEYDDRYRLK